MWAIDRLKVYDKNPRVRSKKAVAKVAASIKEFGFRQPIVVDEDGGDGQGSHADSLVLASDREGISGHPVAKPVAVWRWLMERCSARQGDIVFDPFMGSGTTLITAQTIGRVALGIELSPRYVDVIVARWEKFTGKKAVLESAQVPA